MKTHLRRVLEVAVAVIAACYSTAFASPVVGHFISTHPQDAGYLAFASGLIVAGYKAARDALATATPPPAGGK